jgi:pimeloyl-ACP methyl ester carboxylesterase
MILPIPRTGWLVLARNGLLVVLGLCALGALIEYVLERRDAARLTANETFYTAHGRRIRYHLTGPPIPAGPTLVLLDGISGSLEQWERVQTVLSTVSPVLSYDRGGAGFSDPADAHDANADAEELDELLHSPQMPGPPFVLVSFSSASMMAIVFAARHRDVVKGIIFADPILGVPTPGTNMKSYRRIFWRPTLANTPEAFFGYTRLRHVLATRNVPPATPVSERSNAIVVSTRHWIASAHDALSLDASADEADSVMSTRPFADLPLGVLITLDPALRQFFEPQQKLATRSDRSIVRTVHCEHTQLLNDPVAVASLIDLIQTIVAEGSPEAAASGGLP